MTKKITKMEKMIKVGCTNYQQFNRFLSTVEYNFKEIPSKILKKDFKKFRLKMIKSRYLLGKQGRHRKNT